MIATSRSAKLIALTLAAGLHIGGGITLMPHQTVEIESSAGAFEARLGSSFADMATGTLTAEKASDLAERAPPTLEPLRAETPDLVRPLTNADTAVRAAPPEPTETPQPVETVPQLNANTTPTTAEVPEPTRVAPEPLPDAIVLAPVQRSLARTITSPPPPSEMIAAQDPEVTAPVASKRPKKRTRVIVSEVAAKAPPRSKTRAKEPQNAAPKGNAPRNATAGSATGSKTAKVTRQGAGKAAKQASGNAAASNYGGKVRSRIDRVRPPRGIGSGETIVVVRIASNGGLSGVSVARSSGSSRIDRAALGVIKKAAPFPPPPSGARRTFNITIRSK